MSEDIRCDLIATTSGLEVFRPHWLSLWEQDPNATPFQRPEWLLPWWRQFGQPELRAVTVWEGDSLLALLPFYIYPDPKSGDRQLLLLGVGTTDYLDGIFSISCTPGHVGAALELLQETGGWDVLHASQLRPQSPLLQALRQAGAFAFPTEACSRVPAVIMSQLPAKIRRNAMYYRNRALKRGVLELTVAGESDWEEAFDALQRLHTSRWQSSGEPGVLADPKVLAWHRQALPLLAASGLLRLCCLRLDREIIAVLYSLIDLPSHPGRTQYLYLPAFSVDHADLRPGTLLLALAMENAANEGVATIDMLRGGEAYKQIWHVSPVKTFGFSLPHASAPIAELAMAGSIA